MYACMYTQVARQLERDVALVQALAYCGQHLDSVMLCHINRFRLGRTTLGLVAVS